MKQETRNKKQLTVSMFPCSYVFVKEILQRAARMVHIRKGTAIAVIFVNDQKMRQLNRKYRGKDRTANVLAFPTCVTSYKLQVTRDLGDIFISLPEAKREAKKYSWTLNYEIARLVAHGFLHLLGYDHKRVPEALAMEKIEKHILQPYKHNNSQMTKSQ